MCPYFEKTQPVLAIIAAQWMGCYANTYSCVDTSF